MGLRVGAEPDGRNPGAAGPQYISVKAVADVDTVSGPQAGLMKRVGEDGGIRFLHPGFLADDQSIKQTAKPQFTQFPILDLSGHIGDQHRFQSSGTAFFQALPGTVKQDHAVQEMIPVGVIHFRRVVHGVDV